MENLDEYILRYQQYKEGNYEYKTISSSYDIKKIVETGKKIVFTGRKTDALALFFVAGILFTIGFIVGINISLTFFDWFVFIGVLAIIGIPCIFCVLLGLWKLRTRFLVLGPEGIVYKLRSRGVKGDNWENIKMDFYNYSYIKSGGGFPSFKSVKIHIFMPNGDFIKVEPEDYSCKEISAFNSALFILLFTLYYDYGKNGTINWQARRTEEHKKSPPPVKRVMSTDMQIIDIWRDKLKEGLRNYKKKKYDFSRYWTIEQIQDAFLRKKIFVLRGGVGSAIWIIMLIPLFVLIITLSVMNPIYETFNIIETLNLIVFTVILWFCFSSPLLLVKREFLVISSSGVYYRKFIRKKIFSWQDISRIEGTTKEDYPNLLKDFAIVKIFLLSGKKITFASNTYKNKEFPKKVWVEMFFNLFNSNFRLSKKRFN